MSSTDRRQFRQLMGATMSALKVNLAEALAIPAANGTGTIQDVEHIVILIQENRPFDHHFGTLGGVRGFNDPRAVNINLPLKTGASAPSSVFLQPDGLTDYRGLLGAADFGDLDGPANGVDVIPPLRVSPNSIRPGLKSLRLTYLPGTGHGWNGTHAAWNQGQYDNWAAQQGPAAVSYSTRDEIPYHLALADAFPVCDAYYCSIIGPTNPNRMYLWARCIDNLSNPGPGGADGQGAGPATHSGLSVHNSYWPFSTFPEVLQAAGVSWKFYPDLVGQTFVPDFGNGGLASSNNFVGKFTDNPVLYFNQYATSTPISPLFENGCTGTEIINILPAASAPASDWLVWPSTCSTNSEATLMAADQLPAEQFYNWYDLIITVDGDPTFTYRLAGHIDHGQDSFSDPALGGLVTQVG